MLQQLAREIEETQRRQSDTLGNIVGRLRALDRADDNDDRYAPPRTSAGAYAFQNTRNPTRASGGGEEPWDTASAEALMRTCESADAAPFQDNERWPNHEWLGSRFNDVTKRLQRTLKDLKPGSTMALLAERLDQFQKHIESVLEDVVRRSDIQGLRLIEAHVTDLDDKLLQIERQMARLDGIEADVRTVIEQVSEERIAKLLDNDTRFAADLQAVALRAAEEVHARFGQDNGRAEADARRHEDLRALIEASIQERRHAESEARSVVAGLTGHVNAQADRYDELKDLLERAISEQRQSEQTAVGMLETLQQALVTVLDRIDSLEQQQLDAGHRSAAPAYHAPVSEPRTFASFDEVSERHGAAPSFDQPPSFSSRPGHDERAYGGGSPEVFAPVDLPASFAALGDDDAPEAPNEETTIDRMRREFIADARRAKLNAAAHHADAAGDKREPLRRGVDIGPARVTARAPAAAGGSRQKILAGALALIVAINGGILFLSGKSDGPGTTVPIVVQPSAAPQGSNEPAAAPNADKRSDLDEDATDVEGMKSADATSAERGDSMITPFGVFDDVLNPPVIETPEGAAAAPVGTTIAKELGTFPDAVVADVYEQQVLAGLSGQLGMIAAGKSANALLPEHSGRIDTSYTQEQPAAEGITGEKASGLDLPPATVGPMSLRLAAANGDASAEFEVAARLAEGKGTEQNFVEAIRWYQRSAAKGFAQSQYRLGTLYERGLGVGKDFGRAKVWYGRAAEQGNVKAMHNLAVLAAGDDKQPDYATAFKWFSKASAYGLSDSQFNLGVLYENGLGVTADRVIAYKWYSLAAKGGDTDAVGQRDALKATLSAADVKRGDELVAQFKATPPARLANDARAAGEDWKQRATNG